MAGVRLDLLLLECLGQVVKQTIEPRCKNIPLWDGAIREIAHEKLKELGVPDQPVTFIEVARTIGILGPDPNEIVIENRSSMKRKRRAR